jgi:hypothetical protein
MAGVFFRLKSPRLRGLYDASSVRIGIVRHFVDFSGPLVGKARRQV